jgi:hypothetical protein
METLSDRYGPQYSTPQLEGDKGDYMFMARKQLLKKKTKPTVGATESDMSTGFVFPPVGGPGEMPIVRRIVFFDTRTRDPSTVPDASKVTFNFDRPIDNVSRIAVHSARVPICLDQFNPGLAAEDYVMLSVSLTLPDTVYPQNMPHAPTTAGTFSRALAYVPLVPMLANSAFAEIEPDTPPYKWYVDFLRPIDSLDRIELSWWRFQKYCPDGAHPRPQQYIIHNGSGDVGSVVENAYVTLVFYCKNRRSE